MFATYLMIFMGQAQCSAVAVCENTADSCEAVVLECDAPVTLSECLETSVGFAWGTLPDGVARLEEPVIGLGCSTDLSRGFPATVDVDRAAVEGVL